MKTYIGKKYGHWAVIGLARSIGNLHIYVIQCVCGKRKERAQAKLGSSGSCGCMSKTDGAKRPKAEARDSGAIPAPPEWKPDFAGITSSFTVKRVGSFLEIRKGKQMIDRQHIGDSERKRYARRA